MFKIYNVSTLTTYALKMRKIQPERQELDQSPKLIKQQPEQSSVLKSTLIIQMATLYTDICDNHICIFLQRKNVLDENYYMRILHFLLHLSLFSSYCVYGHTTLNVSDLF